MEPEVRKQVLGLLHSLDEGISYVEKSNHVACEIKVQVLNDCLACILPIENCIGDVEGDTRKAIVLLLGVLEKQIQKMRIALGNQKSLAMPAVVVKRQLLKIKETVIKLRNKKEIVFLPYKASMWDALESIWRAAFEDEDCLTYVVPIPYCNRNSDGSVAAWHYEGHELPSYVPVTDWQQFDLADHRPDVIYIHNAYDDHNWVTSIHPNYYSKELKKYTDMLVYVPYFVSGEFIDPGSCQMMGIINADKVIVESDLIKSQYEANYPGGNPPEDKFLALGSPKFDKVKETNKEVFPLPEGWWNIIQGKKIILYLTTLEPVLKNPESFIAKHQYVFSIFKGREDVALWWRPHPLLKETLASMRPEYVQAYTELAREYKEAGWGIYDESADLNRAIVWSDAYYGDMSSVICLYKATGKPIMVQSLKYNDGLYFDYMEADGDDIWFIPVGYNGLFKMSLLDGKIEFIGSFPGESLFAFFRYRTLMRVNDKIIIIPYLGDAVIEYDIKEKVFTKYLVEVFKEHNINGSWKYNNLLIGMAKYKNYIFMFGMQPVVVRYDLETHEMSYFGDWVKDVDLNYARQNGMMWREYCIKDNLLFINILVTNKVLIFNMDNCTAVVRSIGQIQNQYNQIYFDERYFWLVHFNKISLTRWNFQTDEVLEYHFSDEGGETPENNLALRGMALVDKNLYVFPGKRNLTLKIDTINCDIRVVDSEVFHHNDINKSEFKLYYECVQVGKNNQILLMKSSDFSLSILDKSFQLKQTYHTCLSDSVYENIINKAIKIDNMVQESHFDYGIENFIKILAEQGENFSLEVKMNKENCGSGIHRKIIYG